MAPDIIAWIAPRIGIMLVNLKIFEIQQMPSILASQKESRPTLILDTASSACCIRVAFVGWPSQINWVEPRYRALNRTPSISTERGNDGRLVGLDDLVPV